MTGRQETTNLFPTGGRQPRRGLARGTAFGRYVALRVLGSGSMGIVYLAHDAQLDRNVAIKVCRSRTDVGPSEHYRAGLLNEARALARLSHPNVVQVFDVGVHDGDVYFVMERVEGETLARWLAGAPRSQSAILEHFRAAGRGLAAIHRAGLVHRDFNPNNVIVGREGRVRVVDLGLASVMAEDDPSHNFSILDARLTAGGKGSGSSRISGGTPAYMAPEQKLGVASDSRSDQFSFCVSLLQALTGRRPSCSGGGPAAGAGLPSRLERALSRGLSVNPVERFGSMDGMLAALTHHPWWKRHFEVEKVLKWGFDRLCGGIRPQKECLTTGNALPVVRTSKATLQLTSVDSMPSLVPMLIEH